MKEATKRSILRWIHIVFGIPIIGYIYTPFKDLPYFAHSIRFFFLPVIALSGFWMWKGPALRRLVSKTSDRKGAADKQLQTAANKPK